jgi:hypothetical protein
MMMNIDSELKTLNQAIDHLRPTDRVRYLLRSSDAPIYMLGFLSGVWNVAMEAVNVSELLVPSAYAQSGFLSLLGAGKNYIATLIFLSFLLSLGGAIFASGPGRTASETFAKLLAGGLIGFVSGTKA